MYFNEFNYFKYLLTIFELKQLAIHFIIFLLAFNIFIIITFKKLLIKYFQSFL